MTDTPDTPEERKRREQGRSLYPKLPPGPHGKADVVIANQRARLQGALIEMVAARGYKAGTATELCVLAGVSRRTLYERFPSGKKDCFLVTYELIVRHAQTHVLGAERGRLNELAALSAPERMRVLAKRFATEVVAHPKAARLALIEAPEACPTAFPEVARTRREVERVVSWIVCDDSNAPESSTVLVRGVIDDGAKFIRARLREKRLEGLVKEFTALCVARVAVAHKPSTSGRRRGRPGTSAGG